MKPYFTSAIAMLAVMLAQKSLLGDVIFSQTPPHAAAFASDSHNTFFNRGLADDFTLPGSASVQSVSWRGIVFPTNNPILPLQFSLAIYGDAGGKPDATHVVSSATVSFTALSQFPIVEVSGGSNVYQFTADVPAASLGANTRYWFSPYAHTENDPAADWYWVSGRLGELSAERNAAGTWLASDGGPFYFSLQGVPVPEPTSFLLLSGSICFYLTARRRDR
jgi:hypothetical protein